MASSCVASPPSRNKTTTSRPSSSSSSSFAPRSSTFLTRSSSPLHLSLFGRQSSPPPLPPPSSFCFTSSSMRFSIDPSPRRSMTVAKKTNNAVSSNKRMCMCAPTTHPGSFRCSYHKRLAEQQNNRAASSPSMQSSSSSLNLRRSAMKNSLVRICGVDGELVKRTLTRPSSHQLR